VVSGQRLFLARSHEDLEWKAVDLCLVEFQLLVRVVERVIFGCEN